MGMNYEYIHSFVLTTLNKNILCALILSSCMKIPENINYKISAYPIDSPHKNKSLWVFYLSSRGAATAYHIHTSWIDDTTYIHTMMLLFPDIHHQGVMWRYWYCTVLHCHNSAFGKKARRAPFVLDRDKHSCPDSECGPRALINAVWVAVTFN